MYDIDSVNANAMVSMFDGMCNFFDEELKINKLSKNKFTSKFGALGMGISAASIYNADDKFRECLVQGTSLAIGYFVGGAIGTFLAPFLGPLGYWIGGLVSGVISDFCCHWIGKMYDACKGYFSDLFKNGAGLNGHGPGGVEFKNIQPIIGIESPNNILINNINIFFECKLEQDVLNAFNSLCLPEYRNKTIQEYFETIIQEVSDSLNMNQELPFVSLHFNNNHLLYSVMPPFYKKTLIGNTLAFMDYFLKGFLNGGFFSIEFVRNWCSNGRTTDPIILNRNLIDIKKSLKKVGKKGIYDSLNDLVDQNQISNDFYSAFRIIGEMKNVRKSDDFFFPRATFSVEHDLDLKPETQRLLDSQDEKFLEYYNKVSSKFFLMRNIVKNVMPKVPEFKGLFTILDMITFSYYYVMSLRSIGKTINTEHAFNYSGNECNYVSQIPDVFPPLPVADRREINIKIPIQEIIECFRTTSLGFEIQEIIKEDLNDFSQKCLYEVVLKLESFYKDKIKSITNDPELYDEETFNTKSFCSHILQFIRQIPTNVKKGFVELLIRMEKIIKNDIEINLEDYTKMNFFEILVQCQDNLELITQKVNKVDQFSQKKYNDLQKELEKNRLLEQILLQANQTEQTRNELARVRSLISAIENNDIILLASLQAELSDFTQSIEDFYSVYSKVININLAFIKTIYIITPVIKDNKPSNKIVGGCKINFQKRPFFNYINLSEQEKQEIRSSKNKSFIRCKSGLSGINLKVNIIPLPVDGMNLFLYRFKQTIQNKQYIKYTFDSIKAKLLNYQRQNNNSTCMSPAFEACCCDDSVAIEALIDDGADFSRTLDNGINPFLAAIMLGNHDATLTLLSRPEAKIGNINIATETGMTPLYWAIYYDFPDLVDLILKKGAFINLPMKSDGKNALHLACYHNRLHCLSLLTRASDKNIYKPPEEQNKHLNPYGQSARGLTPLQIALSHSFKCAFYLIDQKKEIDFDVLTPNNLSTKDVSIINGQYEIAKILPNSGKMLNILEKISNKKNNTDFNELCNAFSSGNISIAKQNFENWFPRIDKESLSKKQKEKLLEHACIGGCADYIEILSKVFNLDQFPIALSAAAYGLVDWIPLIEKYGGNLMCEANGLTIFDIAVENSDYEFIKEAFKIVDSVPEKIINRIVKRSIEIQDLQTIYSISEILNDKKNRYILNPSIIFTSYLTINSFGFYQKNLDKRIPIKLNDFVLILSSDLISFLLTKCNFTNNDLKLSVIKAMDNKRMDNAFAILEKNMFLYDEIARDPRFSNVRKITNENKEKAINLIKPLINDSIIPETKKTTQIKKIFKDVFDLGTLPFEDNFTLALIAGKSIENIWILNVLPQYCLNNFHILMSALSASMIEVLFNKIISIFASLYGAKEAGTKFLNSLDLLDFGALDQYGIGNEFITALINAMKGQYLLSVDKNNQTVFHFVSKFSIISQETMKLITETMKKIDKKNIENVINSRARNGETVSMAFAKAGNFVAIEYIAQLDNISFYNRDIVGENILHKIIDNEKATNERIIICISLIIKKFPELILQRNRKNENSFMIAAKKGFNGVIGLMSTFYPTSFLDSSQEKSILHVAAENNQPETIRYIIQTLHVDVNVKSKEGCTPLHFASKTSSLDAYDELISLGGNPLILCDNNMSSIDYAFEYGSEKMIQKVMNNPSFNIALNSPKLLTFLAKNVEGYPFFVQLITIFERNSVHLCNSDGMNLISIASINNNRKATADLLILGCDPSQTDFEGQNSIHICSIRNSIGCCDLILNHVNKTKGSDEIKKILNTCNSNGNMPIHIAAKNGLSGFVTHLLCACKDQDLTKENNSGCTPFAEAIKNRKYETAGILAHYWTQFLNLPIDILINKLSPELKKEWEEEFQKSEDYLNTKKTVLLFKKNIWKNCQPQKNKNSKPIEIISFVDAFIKKLDKSGIILPRDFINRNTDLINNPSFRLEIISLIQDKKNQSIVSTIFKVANKIASQTIKEIAFLIFLPMISIVKMEQFIQMIKKLDQFKIPETHPLFSWMQNGLISIAETIKNVNDINDQIQSIIDLVSFVKNDDELMNKIMYPVLPAKVHEISSCILNIKEIKYRKIQLLFSHLMKVSNLMNSNPTLSIDFCNRIDNESNSLLEYLIENPKFDVDTFEKVIQITHNLYENPSFNDTQREMILFQCLAMISNEDDTQMLKNQICTWISNSMRIIEIYGTEYFNQIIPIIPQETLTIANEALSCILAIGSPKIANRELIEKGIDSLRKCTLKIEKEKFVESRKLDDVLKAFNEGSDKFIPYKFAFDGTPAVKLSHDELESLRIFGQKLESQSKIINITDLAYEKGKAFRDNPNIENAAELISFVRQAIKETFDINPFTVQCLTVFSLLLHRINKQKRVDLKGRISQVATGEGKSIIVAMLAGCIGLTGNCVDIISSSTYLAQRDAEKFKPFYQKLGLTCGTVNETEYSAGFDYHILYSTNTGFEFAFLFEGIDGKPMIETTLLYENIKKQRPRMTAIVDEADNLFIDTAMNSARIAQGGSSRKTWIYEPILESVKKNILNPEIIRRILLQHATNEDRLKLLEEMTSKQLSTLISSAITALSKQRDVHYVIGKNSRTNEKEIQIVDADNTGRVQYGSRWSFGLHEFIEVKEGIPIHKQSNTVASVSHPSFFEPYQEILGLTGTLGETSERKEIFQIYHVDSYDVPPNRKCLRRRDKTLIVKTESRKEQLIVDTIRRIKNDGRPILIIVLSIKESQKLSDRLRNEKINHFLLNDQQPQDEDFVVDHAGRPGAVTVATNTAGRGTDIRIDKIALRNGGLHTLITFWPANLRVECQALGRSARQGQPGSCQIIFVSDEFGNDLVETSEETLKRVYEKRTKKIEIQTAMRVDLFIRERKTFEILKQYFDYIRNLRSFLELSESEAILASNYNGINSSFVIKNLSQQWAEFYTMITEEIDQIDHFSFNSFLNKWNFDKNYSKLSAKFDAWLSNSSTDSLYSPSVSIDDNFNNDNNYSQNLLTNLVSMGFDKEFCKRALKLAGNNIENAINLLLNGDIKLINEDKNNEPKIDGKLSELISMGFDKELCKQALSKSDNNIDVAISLLLNEGITNNNEINNNNNNNNVKQNTNEKVEILISMGFDKKLCELALLQSNDDVEKAADLMLNGNVSISIKDKEKAENKKETFDPQTEKMINDLVSLGFGREKCTHALINAKYDFEVALNSLLSADENKGNEIIENYDQLDSDIFGDLKNEFMNLNRAEKEAVSRLIIYGDPHTVLELYLACDKNEKVTKECLL